MMKVVKKNMSNKQKKEFAAKMAHDFLEKCDGMNAMDAFDILHTHFLYCINNLCECIDLDICEALVYTKEFFDDIIGDIHTQDKSIN